MTLINTVPSAMTELIKMKALPASLKTVNLAGETLHFPLVSEIYRQSNAKRVLNLYSCPRKTQPIPRSICVPPSAIWELCPSAGQLQIPAFMSSTRTSNCYRREQSGSSILEGPGWRGAANRPNITAERFLPNPFAATPGERLYLTGDLVRWLADGNLGIPRPGTDPSDKNSRISH